MKNTSAVKNKSGVSLSLLLLGLVLALLVLSIVLFGCNKPSPTPTIETYYEIDLSYDGGNMVELAETVVYQNNTNTPLTSIAFRLYPNAFKEGASASPFVGDALNQYNSVGKFGGIEVLSVKINRLNLDFVICGTDNTVLEVPFDLQCGDTAVVDIECVITLPHGNHRLGKNQSAINLTGFYPVLCTLGENGWRRDDYHHFGDPFVHDTASYSVAISHPAEYVVAGSGQKTEVPSKDDSSKQTSFYVEHIRDFALVLSKDFKLASASAKIGQGVNVDYYYTDDSSPDTTIALAVDALEEFSKAFGDYPHPSYTLVCTDFVAGGMEYGALSLVGRPDLDAIVHETAHQWWCGIVGSDQISAPWMDEGLAEFSSAYYHRLKGDETGYSKRLRVARTEYAKWSKLSSVGFDGVMNKPIYNFLTEGEYVAVTYHKGAVLFDTLLQIMGEDTFLSALRDYVAENTFAMASQKDLIDAFEGRHAGISNVISSFVEGKDK